MSKEFVIRIVTCEDAPELLTIYAPYVLKTAITFEYEVPSLADFQARIANTLARYPYLAACQDGEILGYAYTSAFHERPAYDWAVETSIYVREDCRGQGIGKRLYEALEEISKLQHILNMNACIAYPEEEDAYLTKNSVSFHEHLGFRWVGMFHQCGYKFGRWYHMVWMEKMTGAHDDHPEAVIPFAMIDQEKLQALNIVV